MKGLCFIPRQLLIGTGSNEHVRDAARLIFSERNIIFVVNSLKQQRFDFHVSTEAYSQRPIVVFDANLTQKCGYFFDGVSRAYCVAIVSGEMFGYAWEISWWLGRAGSLLDGIVVVEEPTGQSPSELNRVAIAGYEEP